MPMFCKCGRMMKNFDGVNFRCSKCGGYHYRDDRRREKWLKNHGSKTCPVCGRVALQPGMLPNNGNGHVCIHCATEYDHDEDSGRYDIYPLSAPHLRPRLDHKGNMSLRISIPFLLVLMVYLAGCAVIVNAEAETIQVEFKADPMFDDINDPVNVDNLTKAGTVIGQWERDFDDDPPEGTFFGPQLPPSKFDFTELSSTWIQNVSSTNLDGRYSFMLVSAHFNLSQQKIMAGASEWWLRTPIDPDSIEAYFGLTLFIFKNVDNASDVNLYGNYSTGLDKRAMKPKATMNGYCPDVVAEYECEATGEGFGDPISDYPVQDDMRIANGRLYLQVNAVLEPSTDYVISLAFRLPEDTTPKVYWTTCETPAGGWSAFDFAEVFIEPASGTTTYIDLLDHKQFGIPMDLDWSFIFTQGVGVGGLFGKRLEIPANHTLVVYPFFNTSMSGSQYMSFNLPFISDETANVTPSVYNVNYDDPWNFTSGDSWFYPELEYATALTADADAGSYQISVADVSHLWVGKYIRVIDDDHSEVNYVRAIDGNVVTLYYSLYYAKAVTKNAHVWCMIPMGWDYSDFVLFSTNDTIDWATFRSDDRWNVEVNFLFNDPINLTLLCYVEDRPSLLWTQAYFNNTTRNPYYHPYTFGRDDGVSGTERMHYKVWMSARGTDGQWVIRNGTASGAQTYTHYFPKIVHLSSAKWELINESKKEAVERGPGWHDPIAMLRYLFQKAIMRLWNGLASVGGFIYDGLNNVWQSLKRFGEFIYTSIVEFVGKIWNFITDAIDTLASFWGTLKYLVAPIICIAIISAGGTISKKLITGRGD